MRRFILALTVVMTMIAASFMAIPASAGTATSIAGSMSAPRPGTGQSGNRPPCHHRPGDTRPGKPVYNNETQRLLRKASDYRRKADSYRHKAHEERRTADRYYRDADRYARINLFTKARQARKYADKAMRNYSKLMDKAAGMDRKADEYERKAYRRH